MVNDNPAKVLPASLKHYSLLRLVGEGGVGSVYKARDLRTGEIVAVKVMAPHLRDNEVLLKRFKQEFATAHVVQHPNIVRALAFDDEGEVPYLVMEFVEGESLGDLVARRGALPEAEAVRLIFLVCQGLHWVHKQGIIHRDVKPDNIIVTPEGQAKLTDLGLVKDFRSDEAGLTNTGRGLGTPHYMAPEQFRNAKNADVRADVYSLGATLYTLVTGELPFASCATLDALMKKTRNELPDPRELAPNLSERTAGVIRRAMSGVPAERQQSCKEFARELTIDQKTTTEKRETRSDVRMNSQPTPAEIKSGERPPSDSSHPSWKADTKPSSKNESLKLTTPVPLLPGMDSASLSTSGSHLARRKVGAMTEWLMLVAIVAVILGAAGLTLFLMWK
jgi:serine/threonine protein kinase